MRQSAQVSLRISLVKREALKFPRLWPLELLRKRQALATKGKVMASRLSFKRFVSAEPPSLLLSLIEEREAGETDRSRFSPFPLKEALIDRI